jgi:hypothetical protein
MVGYCCFIQQDYGCFLNGMLSIVLSNGIADTIGFRIALLLICSLFVPLGFVLISVSLTYFSVMIDFWVSNFNSSTGALATPIYGF